MKKGIIIAITLAAIAVPAVFYAVSPVFIKHHDKRAGAGCRRQNKGRQVW